MRLFFLSLLILVILPLQAHADVIPKQRAKAVAEQFLQKIAPGNQLQLQWQPERSLRAKLKASYPEYYIFTDTRGGFVIAAGDDAVPSILGYSTTASLPAGEIPENLQGWLDMWSHIISEARISGESSAAAPIRVAEGRKKELETALWDQGTPYNQYCIEMDGKRALTGCVATSLAIAMRYHQWPEAGRGTLPSYKFADENTGKSYQVESVELGRPYNWSQMPLRYDGTWTEEQKDEIAYLMRDAGVMAKAIYSPSGTGAYMEDVTEGLIHNMGYDGALYLDTKALYGDVKDWVNKIIDEIDKVGPVVYAAVSEGENPSGHAFILDGYDEYDNLHINWGWSGSGNGYFVMPAFNQYTRNHQAIFGMKKDAGGMAREDIRIHNIGLSTSAVSISVNQPFILSCRSIANYGSNAFEGEVAFAKFGLDGTMDEILCEPISVSMDSYTFLSVTDVTCVVTTPIKVGDVARMVYRSNKTPDWVQVRYDHESMVVGYISIGDKVFLEDIVLIKYNSTAGILTVYFSDEATCELQLDGTKITEGVVDDGASVSIDANLLPPASYILHLQRGEQQKDITLKFGLKK